MNNMNIRFRAGKGLKYGTLLVVIVLACAIVPSCHSKKANKKTASEISWRTFENEYFSIQYPSNYVVEGEFPVGADNLEMVRSDSTLATVTNEIDIIPIYPSNETPWLHIVLSRFKIQLPIRDFMQNSIAFNQMGKVKVLVGSPVDSSSFAGMPSLAVTLVHPLENGDTLVQRQIIVQLPDYELYYINLNCHKEIIADSDKLAPAFEMLQTMKFK